MVSRVIGKTVELEGLRKDGSVFPLALSLSTWKTIEGQYFTGIIRDITERKQAAMALQSKERYQRALLDNFPFAVWLKDKEGRFLAVNQLFAKTFNIPTADDLVGKSDFDIMTHDIAEDYRAHDRIVLESRQKKVARKK